GLEFQIATRLTSFVAVSDEATVDPGDPTRRAHIPHTLPHGMSAAGLGLRTASLPMAGGAAAPSSMTSVRSARDTSAVRAMPPAPPRSPAPKREASPAVDFSRREQRPSADDLNFDDESSPSAGQARELSE